MNWMSWNFMKFHKICFQTDSESFSFLSWKTKIKIFLKKNLSYCQYQNKEALFTNPIFREGFRVEVLFWSHWIYSLNFIWPIEEDIFCEKWLCTWSYSLRGMQKVSHQKRKIGNFYLNLTLQYSIIFSHVPYSIVWNKRRPYVYQFVTFLKKKNKECLHRLMDKWIKILTPYIY